MAESLLGEGRLGFADEKDVDQFVSVLEKYERGELTPDQWKAFRLVNGVYSQRNETDRMMVRVKIPQGILTPPQLNALADVAGHYSTGKGHLTTRQNFQFHFVKLSETEAALRTLADAGLTTREACGNTVRNVTACPFAGASAIEPFDVTPYADEVTRRLLRGPLSSSLPRKFKIAFGGCCGRDCVGAAFNDVGFLARLRDGKPGFRVTFAGGLSTLRRTGILAHEWAPAEDALEIAEAVVRVFNRTGDRKRRHKARLKFVVENLGADEFLRLYREERTQLSAKISGASFTPRLQPRNPRHRPPQPGLEAFARDNVRTQKDGRVAVIIRVTLGDLTAPQLRALANAADEFSEEREARTTIDQNLVLRFVSRAHLPSLHALLSEVGLAQGGASTVADVTSCPGAMSCRIAVTQSRGVALSISQALDAEPALTAAAKDLDIKVSGCPNGCGQHYVAGIGLQGSVRKVDGRAVPQYFVYLGGGSNEAGAVFGELTAKIPARKVAEAVKRLIPLRDAAGRIDPAAAKKALADLEELTPETAQPEDFIDLGEEKQFDVQIGVGECAA